MFLIILDIFASSHPFSRPLRQILSLFKIGKLNSPFREKRPSSDDLIIKLLLIIIHHLLLVFVGLVEFFLLEFSNRSSIEFVADVGN